MKFLILMVVLLPLSTFGASSIGTRGGGDLCEDRIKILRDDIKAWLLAGGMNALVLPQGVKKEVYQNDMLKQIRKAKVKCVGKDDPGYPVQIEDTPKVCKFENSQITCDYDKFMSMKGADQYILIHHEYAGLSGFELPDGADSDYS
ncbi:MAG: hypothetical protein K2Q18_18180, partial [Bdellovibrionales bacterium]|nr:hypothetical protein [Bdellovibrionales bacterium]